MPNQNKLRKIFDWILNIILIILLIIGIYMFYQRFFGGSPTDLHFILWIAGFFSVAILKLFNLVYGINREIGEIKVGVRSGFEKIKIDIHGIKINMGDVNTRLNRLDNNVQDIKKVLIRRER